MYLSSGLWDFYVDANVEKKPSLEKCQSWLACVETQGGFADEATWLRSK